MAYTILFSAIIIGSAVLLALHGRLFHKLRKADDCRAALDTLLWEQADLDEDTPSETLDALSGQIAEARKQFDAALCDFNRAVKGRPGRWAARLFALRWEEPPDDL